MKKTFIIILTTFLYSCSTGRWENEQTGGKDFYKVDYICLKEAQQIYSGKTPNIIIYPNNENKNQPIWKDKSPINELNNRDLYNACMNAHGYFWVTD